MRLLYFREVGVTIFTPYRAKSKIPLSTSNCTN